ncbi:RhaT Permeases of the drug/metabolite transporter (DMT) superfamily [Rhabdaerophilaceae bacterium]
MSPIGFAIVFFVFVWSSGWIAAKYAAPFADPLTFLTIRFAFAFVLMSLIGVFTRAEWPKTRAGYGHAVVSGVLLHAIYLGGVWWAIARGLPAGVSALIAAIQPLLTAGLAAPLAGEKLKPVQITGILLGFAGVMGVIAPKLSGLSLGAMDGLAVPVIVNVVAMLSVTAGTFYQKRFVATGDLRVVSALQYGGAFLFVLPLALLFEPLRFESRWETWAALAWSVVMLSIAAIWVMLIMIRRGAVSKLAALIYLVPPTAAIEAYLMFGETLSPQQIIAMAVAALGVFLATRPS